MPTIRKYQPKDKENVRMVCMHTGPKEALERDGPARITLLATYCDYYIECEPHNCFVIADDNNEAVGYIICAEEYFGYRKRFLSEYAPRTKGLPIDKRVECLGAAHLPRFFVKKYPAHLHIDILPAYQRMGLGSKLMDTLVAHLRSKNIPGVMLGVGSKNEKGINFYKKYGFQKKLRIPFSIVMALDVR